MENTLLIGSILLFVSIVVGKTGYRFGVPTLLLFLVVGMLFGSDGLGLQFHDAKDAQFIGMVALSIILFSGGMDTKFREIKPILGPGIVLSTVGVLLTALFTVRSYTLLTTNKNSFWMYFCEKRELNCLKRLILQRLIYIILMDSNNLTPLRKGVVGVQFLFVAFGATVLVPLLVGLDPSTALFTAGIGTLIFHAVTRGKVPVFLGSSFAFIAPIIKATELYGLPGTLSGMVGVALVYFVMSALVKWQGVRVIERLFPPVVIGPVIILIGLSLAGTGVNMAKENWVLALLSLVTAVVVSMKAKGLLKLIPIFCGIVVGYLAAWLPES